MTTNVYDSNAGLVTTDSRWSITYGRWVLFLDDVNFDKIELLEGAAFMFAGKSRAIQAWKSWIRTRPTDASAMPPHDGMSVCIIDTHANKAVFEARQDIVKDGAYFTGSGSIHAATCWTQNRCARRAIETAKEFDRYTGGEVKFFDVNTKEHNLYPVSNDLTDVTVTNSILERGMVMDISTVGGLAPPFKKLPDLLAANDDLRDAAGKIANGELQPEAPCDGMISEWTDDQKKRLDAALSDVFQWKR